MPASFNLDSYVFQKFGPQQAKNDVGVTVPWSGSLLRAHNVRLFTYGEPCTSASDGRRFLQLLDKFMHLILSEAKVAGNVCNMLVFEVTT